MILVLAEDREPNSENREPNFSRADIYIYISMKILTYHEPRSAWPGG